MTFYSRQDWGSRYDRGGYEIGMVSEFYVHHFNSSINAPRTVEEAMNRVRGAQQVHVNNGWSDIGYSFLVDDLGNIYEGRGWGRSGAHTYGYNSRGYAACWIGDSYISLPTQQALNAIAALIVEGIDSHWLTEQPTIVAHRDRVPDTSCCGDPMYAYLPRIRQLAGTYGSAIEVATPTGPTAIPRWNGDFDMHLCLYRPPHLPGVSMYLLVRGDGTYRIINPSQDMPWERINSKMVQLVQAGLVPSHQDGSPVIGEIFDDGLAELTERP